MRPNETFSALPIVTHCVIWSCQPPAETLLIQPTNQKKYCNWGRLCKTQNAILPPLSRATAVKGPATYPVVVSITLIAQLFMFFRMASVSHPRAIRPLDPVTLAAVSRQPQQHHSEQSSHSSAVRCIWKGQADVKPCFLMGPLDPSTLLSQLWCQDQKTKRWASPPPAAGLIQTVATGPLAVRFL